MPIAQCPLPTTTSSIYINGFVLAGERSTDKEISCVLEVAVTQHILVLYFELHLQ